MYVETEELSSVSNQILSIPLLFCKLTHQNNTETAVMVIFILSQIDRMGVHKEMSCVLTWAEFLHVKMLFCFVTKYCHCYAGI